MRTVTKTRPETPLAYVERVNRAIDYIWSHLAEPLRLEGVSRTALLSPFHFHRVFQALVGSTLADFVRRMRFEKALTLMAHSPRSSLIQIALACGFSSPSDFSRSFKQRYGVPPSNFDLEGRQAEHRARLEGLLPSAALHLERLPGRTNPDRFKPRFRQLPARTVAYIRVHNPYEGDGVVKAVHRLMAWADRQGFGDHQWLGYQWENPEIVALEDCQYHVAVVADRFVAKGEIGRFHFPPMTVVELEVRGGIDLELRALQWLYGVWLPRSGYVPDDQPGFEAWIGRPFAHGMEHFEILVQLPVRPG